MANREVITVSTVRQWREFVRGEMDGIDPNAVKRFERIMHILVSESRRDVHSPDGLTLLALCAGWGEELRAQAYGETGRGRLVYGPNDSRNRH